MVKVVKADSILAIDDKITSTSPCIYRYANRRRAYDPILHAFEQFPILKVSPLLCGREFPSR